jgi:hypothetical protein
MEEIVLNLNDILDALGKILEVIGGSAVVASIFPKAGKLNEKGPLIISSAKKLVNIGVILYNTIITLVNVGGFNFLKAKNKE